jgi:cell division protease FtsH
MQSPAEQQFLMTCSELQERIRGLLGGRAAEEVVFNEVTTGAENDLERATTLARQMVCVFGMSEAIGLTHCVHHPASPFLGDGEMQRDCSEQTAEVIDAEVKRLLEDAYAAAKEILSTHRGQLESVTNELLKRESLDSQAFYGLIGKPVPSVKGHGDESENPPVVASGS